MRTRGTRGSAYTLLTPGNHFVSRLPNLPGALCVKLVTPRLAPARLAEYLVDLPEEDLTAEIPAGFENFFFGLEGRVELHVHGGATELRARSFAYVPASSSLRLHSREGSARLLWIKRRYEPWGELAEPETIWGHAADVEARPTVTPGLTRRELIDPAQPAFDFNISLMEFKPTVELPFVEIHDEEHGLYMTAGGGSYVLNGDEHTVMEHDFIYMAPYCPQWFRAGDQGAEYLLYKDVYRDGF
jgi:(S)-ureidoglycine aminohydrolase